MAYANGRIPSSALMGIPGNGRLLRAAAVAYCALWLAGKRAGVDLTLIEGEIRRTYREFAAQVKARAMWCAVGKCGNAAPPGTSNHGLGITVDLMTLAQRAFIDRRGAMYGWSKRWSDAAWEWWHVKWQAGHYRGGLPTGARTLKKGSRSGSDVRALKRMLGRIELPKAQQKSKRRKVYWRGRWDDGPNYGRQVRKVVRLFQRNRGMKPDGVVGPATWAAIQRAAK